MKFPFFKIIVFLTPLVASCQTLNVRTVAPLPSVVKESSGIIAESNNRFWTHNDSGGEPVLYQFDSTGTLLKTIRISNATNNDWEEIQLDSNGNLYIGDFGNNSQKRTNLLIYKVLNFKNKTQDSVLTAEKIEFSYENQTAFPPTDSLKHFDAEAMLATPDSIYIFTKDFDTQPYSGKTWIYRLPNVAGKHKAKLVGIFETDNTWKFRGAITAAAKSADGKVVLMSYLKLFVFTDFVGREFWRGRVKALDFNVLETAQREAITFLPNDNCRLFITSEDAHGIGGNLSTVNLCDYLTKNQELTASEPLVKIYPAPSVSDLFFEISSSFMDNFYLKVFNTSGHEIFNKQIPTGENKILLENSLFPSRGMYFYRLFQKNNMPVKTGKIIILK